jgi:hypothetical protein
VWLGHLYPEGDILADHTTAERAVQTLREMSLAQDDMDLLDGVWLVETMQHVENRRTWLERYISPPTNSPSSSGPPHPTFKSRQPHPSYEWVKSARRSAEQ